VLIDFDDSTFDQAANADGRGSALPRDDSGQGLRTRERRELWTAPDRRWSGRSGIIYVRSASSGTAASIAASHSSGCACLTD
jgi:hypothetical protein